MENRNFIPGSEWIYFKIYTGTKTADAILKNELYAYIREMMKNNFIDKWFFIRYSDPDFHIRLRLHLKETRNFTCIFNRFFEMFFPLVNSGLVWNIQCDTYQREMERYGANTISMIEDLFFIDSEYIIRLLQQSDQQSDNENHEQQRWNSALILIDGFLSAFSIELLQRKELLNPLAESFKKEFGFTHHHTTKQLNDKYRFFRKDIERVMLWENEDIEITDIIKARRNAIISGAEKIIAMNKTGELQVPLDSLLTSLIHMTMNRWFRTKNRLHEVVIYDFLARYYTGKIARELKVQPSVNQ
ncbi:MAG: thiopeptide-type bacteriocin biosynthesis protein [Tannerella sp.]|nr:thiopeptide-type bacteriocin biosynthesis protein [Tannerella sp.]